MSIHPDGYDLLKTAIKLSSSSLPIETKLERMLQSITDGFQSDRSLHLRPEAILKEGFLYRVAERRKPLWVDETTPFQEEGVLPEERDLLCSSFACIPLSDETSFQGIFYIGFSKGRKFSSGEVDLLLLLAKEIGAAIRNDQLHRVAEETISELTALHEMGKVVASTLKLEELFELILTTGRKILKAKGGVLRIEEAGTGELRVECRIGDYHQTPLDERMAHRVYFEQLIESFYMTQKAAKAANKDIDEDEIKLFANRVKTASENELGKLREEMRDWAKEHPGYAEKLAPIFHKIALRYVNQKNAGTDAYELASESISEAQSLKGLSEASDLRLENYQRDISVGKVQSIASLGISNNMVFGPNYAALMQNLYNDAMNACNGYNASMETCSNVIGAIRTASAIPARAQQVEQQRNQTQMQIQQTLGQAGINMMPMTPAWAGGYYGSQSGFIRNI